jgi:hypothetical protein
MNDCNDCDPSAPLVYLGEDSTLSVRLVNKTTKDPFDLSVASEIEAILPNEDGTLLVKKLSTSGIVIISASGGHLQVVLSASETSLLAASINGGYSDIEIDLTISGKKKFVTIKNAVQILPKRYRIP